MENKIIKLLKGAVIIDIQGMKPQSEEVIFTLAGGRRIRMHNDEDISNDNNIWLEDVVGDKEDLLNTPIIAAEELTEYYRKYSSIYEFIQKPRGVSDDDVDWGYTFYKLNTIKGSVSLRWVGRSNGYYSVCADLSIDLGNGKWVSNYDFKQKYEIWMEGYQVTGNSSKALKLGEYEASSFREALWQYSKEHPETTLRIDSFGADPDSPAAYIWGCRLFDNEEDARKAFG